MHGEIVLDASVVINLLWCGEPERVLRALSGPLIVPDVTSREIVRGPARSPRVSDPLAPMVDEGLLVRRQLTDSSLTTFMELVGAAPPDDLDDGESAAIALAAAHGTAVALDDAKARRVARTRYPDMSIVSTVGLFARPEVASALGSNLGDVVCAALMHARMRVLPEDESWVVSLIGVERAAQCSSLRRRARR